MNDLTNNEWIALITLALTTISGVVAGTIKLVLNGSAQRIKQTQASLEKHIVSTTAQNAEIKTIVDTRHEELHDQLARIKDMVHNVDIRVARIEGGRWKRNTDNEA